MKINKITTGFVIQTFDTETKEYVSQEFVAGDPVEYETLDGESVDAVEVGMQTAEGLEPYLPFDMVQPKGMVEK